MKFDIYLALCLAHRCCELACCLYYLSMCAYQQHMTELQEHLGRCIKTSLCVPVIAHAAALTQSTANDVIAVACLINKRSILSRSVL